MKNKAILCLAWLWLGLVCCTPRVCAAQPTCSTAMRLSRKVYLPLILKPRSPSVRPLPDTTEDIHIFNDQLAGYMSEAQVQFAATHYDGTQKVTRSMADRLRVYNPNLVVLNYRLGLGLGYRTTQDGCDPTGDWLALVEGDEWVHEWPGDAAVSESWFYHWPQSSNTRVLNCDWGWYLMDPDSVGWRAYWSGEVLRQLRANAADGVFADSLSVPNYLGAYHYNPSLPEVDIAFEAAWAQRLQRFVAFAQSGALAPYHLIPNVSAWVTTRDPTNYAAADGVMIEGFGGWGFGSYFDLGDWQLQMDRILDLVSRDKAVLAQQYVDPTDVDDRTYLLACYLLIKGHYTYLNLELGEDPEWFPEYGIAIGSPLQSAPGSVEALWNTSWGVYTRAYSNGLVLVNPGDTARMVHLSRTYYLATPQGGGNVPENGQPPVSWRVLYAPVTQVTLAANRGAVLVTAVP